MPTYYFASKDSKDRSIKKVECSISELDQIIEDNKEHWDLIPSAPSIVSGVMHSKNKPDGWFRDKLKEIKKKLPERYGKNLNTF